MKTIAYFEVDGTPVPKARPRLKRGGAFTPPKTKAYERLVAGYAKRAMGNTRPSHKPIIARMEFYLPRPMTHFRTGRHAGELKEWAIGMRHVVKPDIDNLIKAILDACNGIVYKDDSQVVIVIIGKDYGVKPRAEITFEELEEIAGC